MKVTCISDLHGFLPILDGGDLLIIAGDLTASDEASQLIEFYEWIEKQAYTKKIIIPGNHDNYFQKCNSFSSTPFSEEVATYLCDSGTEFEGLQIYGTPWTRRFSGQNPDCMAFTVQSEFQLRDHFEKIPSDTDILITHSPPFGILDECENGRVGSNFLLKAIDRVRPKLCVFGHIHENGGKQVKIGETIFVNASIVNERYQHVNKPVTIDLSLTQV